MNATASQANPLPIGEREFVTMMALLQALQALAIDAMLPALGLIANDLNAADPNQRQLIIGIFLIGSGIGSLVPGPLADRFGRRPVLTACLAAYFLLNLASALVGDFTTLLVLRGLTGFATAGMVVLPGAIIRDQFEGDRMARLQSLVTMVFMIVPVLAPALGQAVLMFAGWRWIFAIMASMSAALLVWSLLRMPETQHPENRRPIAVGAIVSGMASVVSTRATIGYILGMAATTSMFFTFLGSSQQLIGEHFGAQDAFVLVFGALVSSLALSNFVNSRLVTRFGARRVSHSALLLYLVAGAVNVAMAMSGTQTLLQFSVVMTIGICLTGFMSANFQAIALQPFARNAGIAASVMTFLRMLIGAGAGVVIGQAYDGTPRPMALTMLLAGLVTLAMVSFSERGRLFGRMAKPAGEPA